MSRLCLSNAARQELLCGFWVGTCTIKINQHLGCRCVGYATKGSRILCSHVQTTRAGHTRRKVFLRGSGWLVCRSLLLLFLRNQIILVEYSAHKHSDSVNAAHANKRMVYKTINVHGVLGMYTVVCWIEEYKKQGSVLWL